MLLLIVAEERMAFAHLAKKHEHKWKRAHVVMTLEQIPSCRRSNRVERRTIESAGLVSRCLTVNRVRYCSACCGVDMYGIFIVCIKQTAYNTSSQSLISKCSVRIVWVEWWSTFFHATRSNFYRPPVWITWIFAASSKQLQQTADPRNLGSIFSLGISVLR